MLANERVIRALLERKLPLVLTHPVLPAMPALSVTIVLLKQTQSVKSARKVFINRLREHRIAFHAFQASTRMTKAKQIANRVRRILFQLISNERKHVMHVRLVALPLKQVHHHVVNVRLAEFKTL
jgi:hypothetical protein